MLLEDGDKPLNGKWNFDEDNRQKLPKAHKPAAPLLFVNDVSEIDKEIRNAGIKTIGTVDSKNFVWPINRAQSLELLDFCRKLFGYVWNLSGYNGSKRMVHLSLAFILFNEH